MYPVLTQLIRSVTSMVTIGYITLLRGNLGLKGIIPEFEPLSTDLLEPAAAPESALDPLHLANKVVGEVSIAGVRARIDAKRTTWRDFGDLEAQHLAAIVQEAQREHLSEEAYKSLLDELVKIAA